MKAQFFDILAFDKSGTKSKYLRACFGSIFFGFRWLEMKYRKADWDYEPTEMKCSYLVCSIPRSGTNLLGFSLSEQGLGVPVEYFNLPRSRAEMLMVERWGMRDLDFTTLSNFQKNQERFDDYFELLKAKRTSPLGVWGSKLFWNHLPMEHIGLEYVAQRLPVPPKIIFLSRKNVIAQAISLGVAAQTQQWNSMQKQKKAAQYSFEHFRQALERVVAETQFWRKELKRHDFPVLEIYFEDLSENFPEMMVKVNEFLGFSGIPLPEPPIQRQRSAQKEEFRRRFFSELQRKKREKRLRTR